MFSSSATEENSAGLFDLLFFTHQKTITKITIRSKAAKQLITITTVFDGLSEGVGVGGGIYGGVSPVKKMSSPRV